MKTKRGIYLDLKESDYSFSFKSLKFYFSSEFNRSRFNKSYINYLKEEKLKFNSKYKCNLENDEILAIILYKEIEKRGFRVYYNDIELNEDYNLNLIIK